MEDFYPKANKKYITGFTNTTLSLYDFLYVPFILIISHSSFLRHLLLFSLQDLVLLSWFFSAMTGTFHERCIANNICHSLKITQTWPNGTWM